MTQEPKTTAKILEELTNRTRGQMERILEVSRIPEFSHFHNLDNDHHPSVIHWVDKAGGKHGLWVNKKGIIESVQSELKQISRKKLEEKEQKNFYWDKW